MNTLIAGLALLGVATVAAAGDESRALRTAVSAPPSFETLDRNADQKISRSEAGYDRTMSSIFVASDVDGDGFVSKAEFQAAIEAAGAPRQAATR